MSEGDYVITKRNTKGSIAMYFHVICFVCVIVVSLIFKIYVLTVMSLIGLVSSLYLQLNPSESHFIILNKNGIKFTERNLYLKWDGIDEIKVERHLPPGHPHDYIIITTSKHKRYKI